MSNAKYNYDDNSETWPFFVITLVGVLVIPATVYKAVSCFKTVRVEYNSNIKSRFQPKNLGAIIAFKKRARQSNVFTLGNLFILIGWAVILYLAQYLSVKEIKNTIALFDPFEILGVATSATEKEIKSHYRKLSIKFHPDKISTNLSDAEKLKAEEAFVLINKAYKSLTDETTKENFLKYGHPDGPQAIIQGIALPKFLIEGQGPYLVIIYVVVIAVVLPYIVRKWWNSAKSFTKKGVRTETADLFVEKILNFKPTTLLTSRILLEWVSEAHEIQEAVPHLNQKQILELIEAHTERKIVSNEHDKLAIVSLLPTLLYGLIDIGAYFRNTELSVVGIETIRCIVQAVPLTGSVYRQLFQLPNVDHKAIEKSETKTLGKLLTLSADQQKKVLGITSDNDLEETIKVASGIPILKVLSAEFVVPGETTVPPGSIAHISLKVLVKSAKHHGVVTALSVPKEKLQEVETIEGLKDPFRIVKSQPLLPPAYTPYFPEDSRPGSWISVLALQKDGKLVEQPEVFANLDLANLKLSKKEFLHQINNKGEGLTVGTLKVPLTQPSPPESGNYEFRLLLKSADYFGADVDVPLVMKVQEPPKVSEKIYEVDDEENIHSSDAYFDSEDEEELTESNALDVDDDDDWSDIDTDTDDEDDLDIKSK